MIAFAAALRRALAFGLQLPLVMLLAAFLGCTGDEVTSVSRAPATLTVVAGDGQSATVGTPLPVALTAQLSSSSAAALGGVPVTFTVTSGSGTVSPTTAVTDARGQASTQLTLGASAGAVTVTASVQGATLTTAFGATAVAVSVPATPVASANCSTPTALAAGQAAVIGSATTVCVSGGLSGAEYALVSFNSSTSASSRSTLSVTATGVVAPVNALLAALESVGTADAPAPLAETASRTPSRALDARLHALSARDLVPRIGAARQWYGMRHSATTGARLSVVSRTANVGDLVQVNGNADDACTNPHMRTARVAAVSNKAIVLADSANPAGGYTNADYASIAATFDTLVDPVDRAAFGDPTDVDDNGRVILFFTREVNALTPASVNWYIGGFFWSRDLFPTSGSSDACAGSNVGEMFYLLVPDPQGTINRNVFSKSTVLNIVTATVAHEYQHLINASRRLYVNTASNDFEDTWLDEGLSHVAEELLFYRVAGLAPRQNIGAAAIRRSAASVNAFNEYAIENFGRLESFMAAPSINSPYAPNDSLATRGATWSFLRYATDHQGTGDGTVWSRLVNSTTSGLANLRSVFGADLSPLFRDWATALLLDDVTGADARYQESSWGTRSIFGALNTNGVYPLNTSSLASGVQRTVPVSAGGAAYLLFGVEAGGTASVQWGTLPSTLQLTLVRTK